AVLNVLVAARDNMPVLIGIVEKRLTKWKRLQRNNAAAVSPSSKPAEQRKPATKDAEVAKEGRDSAGSSHSNGVDRSTLATQPLASITNEGLGVCGEHIADYICAYEFGWGKDWDGHDKGAEGSWLEGTPCASKMGKLSKGGSPKSAHVLYKLTDGANGTGIDAVWRAAPGNNDDTHFAIVEAKASKDEDAPKFLRKPNNIRTPKVTSKLGVSGIGDPSELLEPIEEEGTSSGKNGQGKGSGKADKTPSKTASKPSLGGSKKILVQMSREWINDKLPSAVKSILLREQIMRSYSRHLFYAPLYHLSESPKQHAQAHLSSTDETAHREHHAFHYGEDEVRIAVNKRKKALVQKHGAQDTLKTENKARA
ncbi:MAG: hypothetical protein ACRERY_06770, partial [Pseudomonas sp.]